jgi:hypothetical protein
MTVTVPEATPGSAGAERCAVCGAPMSSDQEWCLRCGTARTRIVSAPDWRIPLIVIAAVVLIAAGIFVFALVRATDSAGTVPAASPSATPTGVVAGTATWPPGLDGWTVVLATRASRSAAATQAVALAKTGISDVGVLATSAHPQMHPADSYDVFTGRYPSRAAAQSAAAALVKRGHLGSRAVEVQRPGGP